MSSTYLDDLYALVDCVPSPIFVMDVTDAGVPVYAHYNATALKRLDRALDTIVGKTSIEAFGAEFGTAAFKEQRKTIVAGVSRDYEFQLPMGDEVRVVRTTLSPQVDASGRVVRLIGSSVDVSLEWTAQRNQDKLDNIGSEVEQFVAMAAHDLRTPMRNVMQLAELIGDDFEDRGDGKTELLDLLKETSEKSMSLITDVLSYATTLGPTVRPVLYPFQSLCADVMLSLDPQGHHKLECSEITLVGEKTVMQIVLRNLIDNALQHGQRANMTLQCRAEIEDDDLVKVTLSDDGAGFKNPGTVFLDTGNFKMDSGYGLLAIRKLIRARGGGISASNDAVTGGSRVCFTLPSQAVAAQHGRHTPQADTDLPCVDDAMRTAAARA